MSAGRNISVILTGNTTQLRAALLMASNDINAFTRNAEATSATTSKLTQAMTVLAKGGALALAAGFAYSAGEAAKFEKQMRNVNSISHLTEQQLVTLSKQTRELSTRLPQSADELARGLYDIASSGFQGSAGLEVLTRSAEAASAGMTNTAVSSKAIVAVLNAYGMSAAKAGYVSDVLFQGVNVGVITFEEMANALGDYTGMASIANVSIEETTAAVAAMTLAGISAAEAGTSLNRVLTSLLDPNDALSEVYHKLGYETGEMALATVGLRGLMDQLRTATGGNVTQLIALFPEIRAARGAMALMSNEGQNYAKVAGFIMDADERQGATKRALAEQMKSLANQWKVFINQVNNGAIAVGTKALPALITLLRGSEKVGKSLGSDIAAGIDRVRPALDDLGDAGENLVDILEELWSATKPVAGGIAAIAGAAAVGSLTAVADVLQKVTGLLADHQEVVAVAAGAWIGFRAALLIGDVVGFVLMLLNNASITMVDLATKAQLAGTAIVTMGTSASLGMEMLNTSVLKGTTLMSAFTYALTGATAGAILAFSAISKSSASARSEIQKLKPEGFDDTSLNSLIVYGNRLAAIAPAAQEASNKTHTLWGNVKGGFEVMTPLANKVADTRTKFIEASKAYDENSKRLNHMRMSYLTASDAMNGTTHAAELALAVISGGDASKWDQDAAAMERWARALDLPPDVIEDPKRLADAVSQAMDAAKQATPQTDIMAQAMKSLGDQTETASDKLKAWKDIIDSTFGVQQSIFDATTKWGGAIEDLTKTLKESYGGIDETTEAGRKNREALSGAAGAAIDLAEAYAAAGKKDEAIFMLANTRDQLIKAGEAAGIAKDDMEKYLDTLGLTPERITTIIEATTDPQNLAVVDGAIANLARDRVARIVAMFDAVDANGNPVRPGQINAERFNRRWGGVHEVARWGRIPAHVATDPTILYGERETGGEAMIPRFGDPTNSKKYLDVAASWYGMKVVPMAAGGYWTPQSAGFKYHDHLWYAPNGQFAGVAGSPDAPIWWDANFKGVTLEMRNFGRYEYGLPLLGGAKPPNLPSAGPYSGPVPPGWRFINGKWFDSSGRFVGTGKGKGAPIQWRAGYRPPRSMGGWGYDPMDPFGSSGGAGPTAGPAGGSGAVVPVAEQWNPVGWDFRSDGGWYDPSGKLMGRAKFEDGPIDWLPGSNPTLAMRNYGRANYGLPLLGATSADDLGWNTTYRSQMYEGNGPGPDSGLYNGSGGSGGAAGGVCCDEIVSAIRELGMMIAAQTPVSGPLVQVNPSQGLSEQRIGEVAAQEISIGLSTRGVTRAGR